MNLLLTRPKAQAAAMSEVLEQRGHRVHLAPLLQVDPLPFDGRTLGTASAIILTSANAVPALEGPDDAPLREAMKAVAAARRRFGYRRIHVMLDRQGIVMNQKKLRRLYREEKLQVRRRGGRKRALGTRRPMLVPDRANARWSLDFVSDTFTDGRRFRVLTVVDDYTRERLALIADTSLSGLRVVRELDAIIRWRGRPDTIVSDNGTELTSMAVLR